MSKANTSENAPAAPEGAQYLAYLLAGKTISSEAILDFVAPLEKSEFRSDEVLAVINAEKKLKVLRRQFTLLLESWEIPIPEDVESAQRELLKYHIQRIDTEEGAPIAELSELVFALGYRTEELGELESAWYTLSEIDDYVKYTRGMTREKAYAELAESIQVLARRWINRFS